MDKYIINGWTEGKSYFTEMFKSYGGTENDWNRLENGEVIILNGNEFWIEKY